MMTAQFFTKPMSADYARAVVTQCNNRAALNNNTSDISSAKSGAAKDDVCVRFSLTSLFKRSSRKQNGLAANDGSDCQRLTATSDDDVSADLVAQQSGIAADNNSSCTMRAARKEAHRKQLVASQSLVAMLQTPHRR